MPSPRPLVVFSHLRWNFVFQRPQHLMTRLAARRPVLFIEEPVHAAGEANSSHYELTTPTPGVTVCTPHTPIAAPGFNDEQNAVLRPMILELLAAHAGTGYDLWFYTPMAFPLCEVLDPTVVVYDCMDELSMFKFAPPQLLQYERELIERADVVFTGGPSLYRAKKDRHPNCHCFCSSVDTAHFRRAMNSATHEPAEQADLPHPRLGFFGVIDERFDLPLLAAMAEARPKWQFVMVGPVVKVDPSDLPRHANIHYFGQQSYEKLPEFLKGWDVALLPFAENDSTRFISPTKTLEYMATGKPIVSTPITDVAEPYGGMVGLARTPAEFLEACEAALNETSTHRQRRLDQYDAVLSRTSWNATAAAMDEEIRAAASRRAVTAKTPWKQPSETPPVVVIGAGPTGLSAAYHLGENALLLEANSTVGGWCRSIVDRGFTFDFAGHIMFSNDPYVHEMYQLLLGDNVHWQDREAWIYSKNVYTRYPFQGSLYGLPPDVIKECVVGAIEARFGSMKKPELKSSPVASLSNGQTNGKTLANGNGNGHAHLNTLLHANGNGIAKALGSTGLTSGKGQSGNGPMTSDRAACIAAASPDPKDAVSDCCADGVAESTVPLVDAKKVKASQDEATTGEPRNFEDFIYKVWGAGIAKHFAIPYNRKIWAVPLDQMETSWLGGRVPLPDLEEMIEGALSPKPKPMGPNARFGYPLRGGFQALMDGFVPKLRGRLHLNTKVRSVSPTRRLVTLLDGSEIAYEQLISTMPLPVLIRSMGEEAPESVREAASQLRHTSVRCVNIGVGRENLTEKHWIYYPEDTVFHRIFVQGNASPHCNAPGGFGLTCEITYGPLKPLPCDGDALIRRCIDDCVKVGIFREDDPIVVSNQVDMPFAYVVYDHARPKNIAVIRDWLRKHDIHLAGRYSEWEYYNSDHAFLAGEKVAKTVSSLRAGRTATTVAGF